MAGALEEGVKGAAGVATGIVDSMRSQPLAIAMVLMNIALLLFLFYYLSRITARTETTVQALFAANDKLFGQWGTIVKDQGALVEKSMHCLLAEDALKLLQLPPRVAPEPPAAPARPEAPARPQNSPLQHLLPPDRRTELEQKEVPYLVQFPPLPPSGPSAAPRDPAPAE
jgi:hypothetical protein